MGLEKAAERIEEVDPTATDKVLFRMTKKEFVSILQPLLEPED